MNRVAGIPIAEGINSAMDLPHTLTQAIMYRAKLDSLLELPKDKQPPRNLWDKPHRLDQYLETVWDTDDKKGKGKEYMDIDLDDIE
jgi:hypothetical protein